MLLNPNTKWDEKKLKVACAAVFFSMWLEKGLGLVVASFIHNPFEHLCQYFTTIPEIMIVLGVWATGSLVLTVLYQSPPRLRKLCQKSAGW
jgi:molybdopterin-containing oxidoreductase family membrane subunit